MRILLLPLALATGVFGQTSFYLVEESMQLPGGRQVGTSISIVKRVVDRPAGEIREIVLSLRGKEPAQEFVTLIRPDGDKATLSSPQGGFTGEAKLSGPAWAWNRMTFTTKLDKGGVVDGEDEFSPETLTATKKVSGPDGKLQIVIRESGKSISEPVYQMLRSRLLEK